MCGRYFIDENSNQELLAIIRALNNRLKNKELPISTRVKSGEIFPSDLVPVITNGRLKPCYQASLWGFKSPIKKGLIINARQESILSKSMFANSIMNNRVVIPSNGFFE